MVFPIFLAAVMIDDELLQASRDLGGGTVHTLLHVILPLVMPGIIAGIVFTFVPMLGATLFLRCSAAGTPTCWATPCTVS